MYLQAESLVEGDRVTILKKFRIEGDKDELRNFALGIMDAVESGKKKINVDGTKVIVKCLPKDFD